MKRLVYFSIFALVVSALIYQSTSYSNAGVTSEVEVSAVQEGQALISIHYGEGRQFWIANNTDQTVSVAGTHFLPVDSSMIAPARMQGFVITEEPESINGLVLGIEANWGNGGAVIDSEIPQSNIDMILLELVEEEIINMGMEVREGAEVVGTEEAGEEAEAETVEDVLVEMQSSVE